MKAEFEQDAALATAGQEAPPTLLVADDDPDILRIVQFYLQKQKFHVLGAGNGVEALELLQQNPQVDLILSDVMMPKMSGLELLEAVRNSAEFQQIPVILISAEGESSKKVAGLNQGADDYITKPFNFDELMARVQNHLNLRRLQRQLQVANETLHKQNEQFRTDLEAARGVQMALLPEEMPHGERYRIGTRYVPMERVGGDFFDVVSLSNDEKVGILVADVCGHGIAAALVTAITKISFRNVCFKTMEPAEVLADMNRALCANMRGGFVTVFYGVYDRATQQLAYASGGHPPLLVHRRDSTHIAELAPQATFLGVFETVDFRSETHQLTRGDRVLFYTDGIFEGQNGDGEPFGMERVCDIMRHDGERDVEALLDDLLERFRQFRGKSDTDDDITLVGLDILV